MRTSPKITFLFCTITLFPLKSMSSPWMESRPISIYYQKKSEHTLAKVRKEISLLKGVLLKNKIPIPPIRIKEIHTRLHFTHEVYYLQESKTNNFAKKYVDHKKKNEISIFFVETNDLNLTGFSYNSKTAKGLAVENTIWLTQNIYNKDLPVGYTSILAHELAHVITNDPYHNEEKGNILSHFKFRKDKINLK